MSKYRGFQLGMTVAAVAQEAGVSATGARALHERPQLIQELDWLPQLQRQQPAGASEAARMVRFTFYAGRLYQITVAYDRDRIEGLTGADFVEAISTSYGPAILASTQVGMRPRVAAGDAGLMDDGTITAQWEDDQYSVRLMHTDYPSAFELVLVAKQSDQLAHVAMLASTRLALLAAPQIELDRQRKQADEDRAKTDKARRANKPLFRF